MSVRRIAVVVCLLGILICPIRICAEREMPVPYRVDNKWGLISKDGTVVLEPKYEYVSPFYQGCKTDGIQNLGRSSDNLSEAHIVWYNGITCGATACLYVGKVRTNTCMSNMLC